MSPIPANKAFVGRVFLCRGDGASPEVFTRVTQTFALSGVGTKNTLVDITTFSSGGSMEYAAGLADGTEITAELNMETSAAVIKAMMADDDAKAIRNFQVELEGTELGTVDMTYSFAARCMGHELKPAVDKKNTISFSLKISGPLTYV